MNDVRRRVIGIKNLTIVFVALMHRLDDREKKKNELIRLTIPNLNGNLTFKKFV